MQDAEEKWNAMQADSLPAEPPGKPTVCKAEVKLHSLFSVIAP